MSIFSVYPVILQNGTVADANQVMANFFAIQEGVNTNAAHNGANSDITSLNGLTTPLPISEGGTGASTAAQALINLGITAALAAIVAVPVGGMLDWGSATPPTSFMECNGQALSRTNFPVLFGILGTTFGAGDGSTTFNIPDMRGYFARGWSNGSSVDSGRTLGTTQADEFQTHTHSITDPQHQHTIQMVLETSGSAGVSPGGPGTSATTTTENAATGITVNAPNTGSTGAETRPVNVALMKIIRVQ
jgi:microcystin-dependent protein